MPFENRANQGLERMICCEKVFLLTAQTDNEKTVMPF